MTIIPMHMDRYWADVATDRSPPWKWGTMALYEAGPGLTRVCVTRDPLRRREELQAGCPWDLRLGGIAFASRPLLDAFMPLLAGRIHKLAPPFDDLRPGWWPMSAEDIEDEAVGLAHDHAAHIGAGLVHPKRLRGEYVLDLADPEQARFNRLLDLLQEAGH